MRNGKDEDRSKMFWETLVGFDLYSACQETEEMFKKIHVMLLGRINHDLVSSSSNVSKGPLNLFTHDHLPIYQNLNNQLIRLGQTITKMSTALPIDKLVQLEKEYQALKLFLDRKDFLDIYQKQEDEFELSRQDMVTWYNQLMYGFSHEYYEFYSRVDNIVSLSEKAYLQRQSLIAILYKTKEEYREYLVSKYKNKDEIDRKWRAYFGGLVWNSGADDICSYKEGVPLSINQLWERIDTIFLLSKRNIFIKDSQVKFILLKNLQNMQKDSGIAYFSQLNKFQLIKNYALQKEFMTKLHFSATKSMMNKIDFASVKKTFQIFRRKAISLLQQNKTNETMMVDFISKRVDRVIDLIEENEKDNELVNNEPTLMINSILDNMLRHYPSIIYYLNGILTSLEDQVLHGKKGRLQSKTDKIGLSLRQLFEILHNHKLKMSALELDKSSPGIDYEIHLEKIAFCETLYNFNNQMKEVLYKKSSHRFFSIDVQSMNIMEQCIQLSSSNLSQISASLQKLRKIYLNLMQSPNESVQINDSIQHRYV